jgi:hypothetical protein
VTTRQLAGGEREPVVTVVSTLEFVRAFAIVAPPEEVAAAIIRIKQGAAFVPPSSDPLTPWWESSRTP